LIKNLLTPLKAIRAKYLDCSCGSCAEVRKCEAIDCPLFPYRFGHNPKRAGIGGKKVKSDRKMQLNQSFLKENAHDTKLDKQS